MSQLLFHIDTIVVDGAPVAFEDGSGTIEGASRYTNTVVPSASGDDFNRRQRVPTLFRCRIQFNETVDPSRYAKMQGVQIAARDQQSGRRALMTNCSFGEMGAIGGGAVDITFNVLSPIQWL